MNLSSQAQALYDALPEDGSMLSGGKLRASVVMSNSEFDAAKQELRDSGAVTVGRGRGGTLGRLSSTEGEEIGVDEILERGEEEERAEPLIPVEGDRKPTPQERMAIARAAKTAKTTAQRQLETLRETIRAGVHKELYPEINPDLIKVLFYGGWPGPGLEPYVEVGTKDGGAEVVRISEFMDLPEDWRWRL